jgi:sugar lactone lactonase YvrE
MSAHPRISSISPAAAIPGGRITIKGSGFSVDGLTLPEVLIADQPARVVFASSTAIGVLVPAIAESGRTAIRVSGVDGGAAHVDIAVSFATGLHQVDNPAFDAEGNLYVTYSGTRGQEVPVSIFRVRPNGVRETFSSGIVNPTSMAVDPDGRLYVSSRFEGTVYRVANDGTLAPFATDLGVACGLAFSSEGTLFVGDRSGTIFKVDREGHAKAFATLPPSVAAFHLALSPDGVLYVSAPTLSAHDAVYRIAQDGTVTLHYEGFGRPQGIAFDRSGALCVVEALAGNSGLYRFMPDGLPDLVLSGPNLVGVAFDPWGGYVVCSNDTAYRVAGSDAAGQSESGNLVIG